MTPVTSKVEVPLVMVLPIGSLSPKYLPAAVSERTILPGSLTADRTSPFNILYVKMSNSVEST
jgi:hypothetical protein